MSLVWHIVRKDLRRLWLPLTLWLLMVLGHTALLAAHWGDNQTEAAAQDGLRYFAGTWGVIVASVGFVLAAWLVMEDSLVAPQAFWPTRPISGFRLLAAKALGAFLMFSVAPVLVLTPVWLGCGFSIHEFAWAAWEVAAVQGAVSAAAMAIAGVTATSGQFLVRAVGAAVLLPLSTTFISGQIITVPLPRSIGVDLSQARIALLLLFVTPLIVIVHQYLTRRTLRTWALGGFGLGLFLAIPFAWKWDISPLVQPGSRQDEVQHAEIREVKVIAQHGRVDRSMSNPDRRQLRLEGLMGSIPAGTYLRINASRAEWVTGNARLIFPRRFRAPAGSGHPPADLGLQVAGLLPAAPERTDTPWVIEGEELNEQVDAARAASGKLEVTVSLTLMRGRVLGELPLRVGAELRAGACLTRITGIERDKDKVLVRLQDRDVSPLAAFAPSGTGSGFGMVPVRTGEDFFVLVHRPRAPGQDPADHRVADAQIQTGHSIGTVRINSILVGQRELSLDPPLQEVNGRLQELPDWEQDVVIRQVRFEPEFTFTRPLAVNPFAP